MKMLRFSIVLVLVTMLFTTSLAVTHPALAKSPDRSDNKVLVYGVPPGWAIQVAQPGSDFPRGQGNMPDNSGISTNYAPLNRVSQVYLWNKPANQLYLIATISPTSTWPDTAITAPVQYAQGFPNSGLASPIQVNPIYPAPAAPLQVNPIYPAPARPLFPAPSTFGQQQYVVRPGDSLSAIARLYGTTAASLAAVNGISNPNLIFSGQVLTIPGPGQ